MIPVMMTPGSENLSSKDMQKLSIILAFAIVMDMV